MMEREKILRGIMTLLVLDQLSHQNMHGYALQQVVSERLKRRIAPGTIYVLLTTMLRRGFIVVKEENNVKNRIIKTYSITHKGLEFLLDHREPLRIVQETLQYLIPSIELLAADRNEKVRSAR